MNPQHAKQSTVTEIVKWLALRDIAPSSMAMISIAMGIEECDFYDAPRNAEELGCSIRLVEAIPALRDHFNTIAMKVPAFAGVLAGWDDLEHTHHQVISVRDRQSLDNLLKELRGDQTLARSHDNTN